MTRALAILCVLPFCVLLSIVPGCRAQSQYDDDPGATYATRVRRSAPRSATVARSKAARTGKARPSDGRNVSVDLSRTPLRSAVGAITSGAGVNVVISPQVFLDRSPEELRVTLKLNDATVETALNWITRLLDLRWSVEYGVVYITLPYDAPRDIQRRVYRVGDLTAPTYSGSAGSGPTGSGSTGSGSTRSRY